MSENEKININVSSSTEDESIDERASKVLAFKKAMLERQQQSENQVTRQRKVRLEDESGSTKVMDLLDPNKDWEKQIPVRVARRVQRLKTRKNAVPEIQEIDGSEDIYSEQAKFEVNLQKDENKTPLAEGTKDVQPANESCIDDSPETQAESYQDEMNSGEELPEQTEQPDETENAAPRRKKNGKKKKRSKSFLRSFIELFPSKKDKLTERIRKLVFLGSVWTVMVCGYIIANYYVDITRARNNNDRISEDYKKIQEEAPIVTNPPSDYKNWVMLPGAKLLYDKNSDVVGWIEIPSTEIKYVVVQAKDNVKYLDIDMNGNTTRAGSIFLDYRNCYDRVVQKQLLYPNSQNLIVYGHNMQDGQMFGNLKKYRDISSFYGDNPIIQFNSNYTENKYKIFAFFIADAEDKTETFFDYWNKLDFENDKDFYDFVNEAKRRTIRLNDVDVRATDQLLTLSTCNTLFGQNGGGRMVVMARKLRDGEDELEGTQNSVANPNIKWPSSYYKYNSKEVYDPKAEFVPYPYSH